LQDFDTSLTQRPQLGYTCCYLEVGSRHWAGPDEKTTDTEQTGANKTMRSGRLNERDRAYSTDSELSEL